MLLLLQPLTKCNYRAGEVGAELFQSVSPILQWPLTRQRQREQRRRKARRSAVLFPHPGSEFLQISQALTEQPRDAERGSTAPFFLSGPQGRTEIGAKGQF